jgi:hypothetical protein
MIWKIVGDGKHTLSDVDLGIQPAGYVQTYPVLGKPRQLRSGETVVLVWQGDEQRVRHEGQAKGPSSVLYGWWSAQPTYH